MKEYLINRSDTLAFPVPNMNTGMTLRDYFAAKAMQALIDNDNLFFEIPTRAYEIADAMMAARSAK
jgi:hypothetical protein